MEITQDRIVRFVMPATSVRGGETPARTAIVSDTPGEDGTCTLHVLLLANDPAAVLARQFGSGAKVYEGLLAVLPGVKHDQAEKKPGTWHWAARAPLPLPTVDPAAKARAEALDAKAEKLDGLIAKLERALTDHEIAKGGIEAALRVVSPDEKPRTFDDVASFADPGTDPETLDPRPSSDENEHLDEKGGE